jgi:hypothetical protein
LAGFRSDLPNIVLPESIVRIAVGEIAFPERSTAEISRFVRVIKLNIPLLELNPRTFVPPRRLSLILVFDMPSTTPQCPGLLFSMSSFE